MSPDIAKWLGWGSKIKIGPLFPQVENHCSIADLCKEPGILETFVDPLPTLLHILPLPLLNPLKVAKPFLTHWLYRSR